MFDCAPDFPLSRAKTGLLPLQQTDLWQSAVQAMGSDARMEDLCGSPVLVLRKRLPLVGDLALVSRAGMGLTPEGAASLRTRLGARHLVINAETPGDAAALAATGFHQISAPRMVAELTLRANADDMARALAPKWRNRLRHGQAQGLVLRRRAMPADPGHWLLKAEAKQAARLWYQPLPPELIAALAAARPDAAQLFTAYHMGQRVAAMLFFRHGCDATYQIGWTSDAGRARSAGPALMWQAMVALQQVGVDRIDLGAADPVQAPGLARFKRGTGAQLRTLGGTWLDTAWARRRGHRARLRAVDALHAQAGG